GREPHFGPLLDSWGGVSILYRKGLADSPAYRLNHEEVIKCLEEGVRFVEGMAPKRAVADQYGALTGLLCERQGLGDGKWKSSGQTIEFPARTLCVAAGTSPNTIYEKERRGTFELDKNGFFRPHRAELDAQGGISVKADDDGFFTSYCDGRHTVSYYG